MGFRFRKSVSIGPFRVNASKSGIGWSVGVPGVRYTQMANGRKRATASIPGTGLSWVEESKKTQKPVVNKPLKEKTAEELTGWECFGLFLWDVIKWTFLGVLIAAGIVCLVGLPFLWVFLEKAK